MSDAWNLSDPERPTVAYDLSAWSFDHQAELAARLAEAEVPHAWEGTELVVPEEHEAAADSVIAAVEQEFGIDGSDDGAGDAPAGRSLVDEPVQQPLVEGRLVTEYDLADWEVPEREAVTRVLLRQQRPFAWEGTVLVVHADDEDVVDSLLDMIEEAIPDGVFPEADDDADGGRLPFETLTTFFLMADRLRRDPLDADGLEQLLDALDVVEPSRPPYGVDVRLWERTCELADELAGALADEDEPDHDEVVHLAAELHELLRPFI